MEKFFSRECCLGDWGESFLREGERLPNQVLRLVLPSDGVSASSVSVYAPNVLPKFGSYPPLDFDALTQRGVGFMEEISALRLSVDEDSPLMRRPQLREWLDQGGSRELAGVCSKTTSFRRHTLPVECKIGGRPSLLQVKIPGESSCPIHRFVSDKDFYFGAELCETPVDVDVIEPVVMLDFPAQEVDFYGERRLEDSRMIFFRYVPGFRLFSMGQQLAINDAHLTYISASSGKSIDDLARDIVSKPMGFLGLCHGLNISLGLEAHIGNWEVNEVGSVPYCCDFGVSNKGVGEADALDERDRVTDQLDRWFLQTPWMLDLFTGSGVRELRDVMLDSYESGVKAGSSVRP